MICTANNTESKSHNIWDTISVTSGMQSMKRMYRETRLTKALYPVCFFAHRVQRQNTVSNKNKKGQQQNKPKKKGAGIRRGSGGEEERERHRTEWKRGGDRKGTGHNRQRLCCMTE